MPTGHWLSWRLKAFAWKQAPLDTAELASILVPALAATDLDTLAEALGVTAGRQ